MPTAPTMVDHKSSVYNTTGASKSVTPNVGWQTGDIIVVVAINEGGHAGDTISTPTATALTFSDVINHAANSNCCLLVSTATAGSTTGPNAITVGQSRSTNNMGMSVFIFRGSDGVGNNASQFTATRTVSLTPVAADSAIVWAVGDWAAAAVVAETPTALTDEVQTQVSGAYTAYVKEITDQTSAGAVSYGVGGTGTGPFSIGVLEIKGAAGGGATTAPKAQSSASGTTWTWSI